MARPTKVDVKGALRGLRIDPRITQQMIPTITFSPTIGIVTKRIDKLGMDIRSFHEPLKRSIQKVIAPSFRRNFEAGGRPPWENFADDTPAIQEAIHHVGSHPLLVKSGRMKSTIQRFSIWTVSQNSAILDRVPGSIWYANLQQGGYQGSGRRSAAAGLKGIARTRALVAAARQGGQRGTGAPPIPARPFVMLQPSDNDAIQAEFATWLEERINKAWP
jgi:phage gpG-like protein